MATIGDYTSEILKKFRLSMDEAELEAFYLINEVQATETLTKENVRIIDVSFIGIVTDLLIAPDKTTGDTSLKWDRSAVLAWYRLKCKQYGLPDDQYEPPSEINDLSDIW